MNKIEKSFSKKQLKKLINQNGIFQSMKLTVGINAPAEFAEKVPEGATYFEGIASTGNKNRNGYIIRAKAWEPAIAEFFKNPIILLQHDTRKPIGNAIAAEVVGDELHVKGYIFDDMTEGAFGRNLLKALSTGHIPEEFEFEHEETGEVISEDEYNARRGKGEIGWGDENWILCVTKLQWVEFSLVAIGAERSSFITKKNAILSYLKNGKLTEEGMRAASKDGGDGGEEDEDDLEEEEGEGNAVEKEGEEKPTEKIEEETGEDGEKKEEEIKEEKPAETPEEGKPADGEQPPAPANPEEGKAAEEGKPAEGDAAENKITISEEDRAKLEESAKLLEEILSATVVKNSKAKEEKPAETKPAENAAKVEEQPATKTDGGEGGENGENALGEITQEEFNSLPVGVQKLFHLLGSEIAEQSKTIENLNAELTKAKENKVQKKVLVSQFGAVEEDKGKEDNSAGKKPEKKITGAGIASLLSPHGISKS